MATDRHPGAARRLAHVAIGVGLSALIGASCRTASPPPPEVELDLDAAVTRLSRALPGDLVALYRLRVPSSGGLRLSIATASDEGRVTISEPFGAALSLTAWSGARSAEVFDLRHGCRFMTDDLSGVLGVGNLPLPHMARLLGGRLPAIEGDEIEVRQDGRLRVVGPAWQGLVELADDPLRVVGVEDQSAAAEMRWRVELRDHTSSVPGWLRVRGAEGRWAELELVRLEWNQDADLPPVPELPACGGEPRKRVGSSDPTSES